MTISVFTEHRNITSIGIPELLILAMVRIFWSNTKNVRHHVLNPDFVTRFVSAFSSLNDGAQPPAVAGTKEWERRVRRFSPRSGRRLVSRSVATIRSGRDIDVDFLQRQGHCSRHRRVEKTDNQHGGSHGQSVWQLIEKLQALSVARRILNIKMV